MNSETLNSIVDFVHMATLAEAAKTCFHMEVPTVGGATLSVSRNAFTGGRGAFYATLPVEANGTYDMGRSEGWQTLADVAERIATLSE